MNANPNLSIEIRHRREDRVVYRSTIAKTTADAVVEAVKAGANLSDTNLSGAKIVTIASVQFSTHGECGRSLLAINTLWRGRGSPVPWNVVVAAPASRTPRSCPTPKPEAV